MQPPWWSMLRNQFQIVFVVHPYCVYNNNELRINFQKASFIQLETSFIFRVCKVESFSLNAFFLSLGTNSDNSFTKYTRVFISLFLLYIFASNSTNSVTSYPETSSLSSYPLNLFSSYFSFQFYSERQDIFCIIYGSISLKFFNWASASSFCLIIFFISLMRSSIQRSLKTSYSSSLLMRLFSYFIPFSRISKTIFVFSSSSSISSAFSLWESSFLISRVRIYDSFYRNISSYYSLLMSLFN